MIEIPCSLARRLRLVLGRCYGALTHRKIDIPVLLETGTSGLVVSCQHEGMAVRFVQRGSRAHETLALSARALGDFAGPTSTPVILERTSEDVCVARWSDGDAFHDRECRAFDPESLPPFPLIPASLTVAGPGFVGALHQAMKTATQVPGRFDMQSVQLRGPGDVIATDGRQLLAQRVLLPVGG